MLHLKEWDEINEENLNDLDSLLGDLINLGIGEDRVIMKISTIKYDFCTLRFTGLNSKGKISIDDIFQETLLGNFEIDCNPNISLSETWPRKNIINGAKNLKAKLTANLFMRSISWELFHSYNAIINIFIDGKLEYGLGDKDDRRPHLIKNKRN